MKITFVLGMLLALAGGIYASGCYGNINNVDTTGASASTARQDRLDYSGVPASRKMASNDKTRMSRWKSWIVRVGGELCVDPAVIAAIISRETRAGAVLPPSGFGSDGHGYGLMQVDDRSHKLDKSGGPESYENIYQGTGILVSMIGQIDRKFPSWNKEQVLKGGIAAYNCGASRVRSYPNVDASTTGRDYGNDVVARAKYYKENGY